MPINTFWTMERHITRLQAERDLRQLNIAVGAQGQGVAEVQSRLIDELGTVVIAAPKLDRTGLGRLASMKQGVKAHGD